MTPGQADILANRIVAGWVGYQWRPATIANYIAELERIDDYSIASDVIDGAIRTQMKPPPIADLLAQIRGAIGAGVYVAGSDTGKLEPEDIEAGRAGVSRARAIIANTRDPWHRPTPE